MAQLDDFLKPESMLTPGLAGGMAMMITNTLYLQFGLAQKGTCLIISFALGALVFIGSEPNLIKKLIYYALNSLVIFTIAIGTNAVGTDMTPQNGGEVIRSSSYLFSPFISDALADDNNQLNGLVKSEEIESSLKRDNASSGLSKEEEDFLTLSKEEQLEKFRELKKSVNIDELRKSEKINKKGPASKRKFFSSWK